MRILIHGINYSPELTGIGKYTGEMSSWLGERRHEVRVVTAPPYYPLWKIAQGYSGWKYSKEVSGNVITYRTPLWVPRDPGTISRILHLLSFALSSFPALLRQLTWRPDVVICIAPTFFCAPLTLFFCRLSGAKSWLHIQDFELDAMLGLGMAVSNRTASKIARWAENSVMLGFSRVSSISLSMLRHAERKGIPAKSLHLFPNWVDTGFIAPLADRSCYRRLLGFDEQDIIILYSGNFGKKQGLELVLEAAQALRHECHIRFVLVGEGVHKKTLQKKALAAGLDHVHFYPLQPYQALPDLLAMADFHLVIQKRGAADVVLPSKLTSILAAGGHAIITADQDTELGALVRTNPGIGHLINPEDAIALAECIVDLSRKLLSSEKRVYNLIARNYAVEHLGKNSVLSRFEEAIVSLMKQG